MEDELVVLTAEDLFKMYPSINLEHGARWGEWRYNAKNYTLWIKRPPRYIFYEIDLEQCNTAGAALRWITHLREKNWITDKDLADLVQAFQDILDLYSLVENGPIPDIKKYLKNRTYTSTGTGNGQRCDRT